jgi:4-aminobutyrate aminotransferase-like enzyme
VRRPPGHLEIRPDVVTLAKALRRKTKAGVRSLRQISAELAARGHLNREGRPFSAASVMNMLSVPASALAKPAAEVEGAP